MSHGDIPKYPLPTVEDHSDMKARMDLTTKFNAIYDREWRMAYSELYDSLRWKDAECIYSLMRVVRVSLIQYEAVHIAGYLASKIRTLTQKTITRQTY